MESYMGHIRDMAVKRADSLQYEAVELRTQMDSVTKLLGNTKLQPGPLDLQVNDIINFVINHLCVSRSLFECVGMSHSAI